MHNALIRAALALVLIVGAGTASGASRAEQLHALQQELKALFVDQQMVGLQAAIFYGGRIAASLSLGHADLEHGVPVFSRTRFEIASITKCFTALGLLLLQEQGRIDIDEPIQKSVPRFPEKPGGTITPRLLAGALGGIRHYDDAERTPRFYATHYRDVADALALFEDDALVAVPGKKVAYSSYAYNLLAAAVQGASGERFQDYIRRVLLVPLGLEDTGFVDVRVPLENRSRSYSFVDPYTREVSDRLRVVPTLDHSYNAGGGNMYSTATDLATFGSQFLEPGFVPERVLQQIYEPHFTDGGEATYFSDGWLTYGLDRSPRYLVMAGSYPGTLAQLMVYPELGVVVAYVANTWGPAGGATFGPRGSINRLAEKVGDILR